MTIKSVRDLVAQRTHIDLDLLFQPSTRHFKSLPSSPLRAPRPPVKAPLPYFSTERRRSLPRAHRPRITLDSRNLKTFLPPIEPQASYRDQLIKNSLKLLEMKRQVSSYLLKDPPNTRFRRPV